MGREFDKASIKEMKPLVGTWGVGIDAVGEPGVYHTTLLDTPLFKETIEITKFSKKSLELDFGGSPNRVVNFLYRDIEEAVLKPKKSLEP